MKEVVKELIEIIMEELASAHRYTDCGGNPSEYCLEGVSTCESSYKCAHSYKLEKQFIELLKKIEG
jgi:hypothetical protein